jgi:ADP-ribose pyrophosphatase
MTTHSHVEGGIADCKTRAFPGDTSKGEIAIVRAGEFEEQGPHVQALHDDVEFPNGHRDTLVRVTRSPQAADGVVVVPITPAHRIVLVRQFRHAPRTWTWELPRGATEPGATPGATMHEELLQEIGYQAIDAPFSLGRVIPDSGTLHEIPFLVAVSVREHPEGAQPDANERIAGHTAVSYDELWHLCVAGAINDSFTMAAALRLRPHFNAGRFEIDQRYIHKYSAFEFTDRSHTKPPAL